MSWQLWLILGGILLISEMAIPGFLIFWFGIGALITMIISFFTSNIFIQLSVFLISSTLLLFCTRPFVKRVNKKDNSVTNAFTIIGKNAIVKEEINPSSATGQIKIDGEVWSAKSQDDKIISKDTKVKVVKIEGVKAVVTTDMQ